ncbi:MAG: DUF58 domain-containing protein [Candidatus Riflebacteria bacterium]|nr:DUF58 domain-containing protein [Candidatus Riflebacteria bacterium]
MQTTLEALVRLKGEARGFSLLPRQPVASLLSGRHGSRLRGRGLAFEELRHYVCGDDVRSIDWKATARLRSPHVRVYSEERERPVLLVVDQRRAMFFGSRRAMKSVTAAEVAALGAWRALAAGDRVGGIVFGDDEIVEVPPHRSQVRVLRLFYELVRLNQTLARVASSAAEPGGIVSHGGPFASLVPPPEPPPGSPSGRARVSSLARVTLDLALEAALRRADHDHLVVLVSDLTGADDETQRLITLLAAHNDVLVVAIYDPLGGSLRGRPGMVATDGGATFAIPPGAAFAASFEQVFEAVVDRWRVIFRALRVPVIPLSTAVPPAEQLRGLFGARRQRRARA